MSLWIVNAGNYAGSAEELEAVIEKLGEESYIRTETLYKANMLQIYAVKMGEQELSLSHYTTANGHDANHSKPSPNVRIIAWQDSQSLLEMVVEKAGIILTPTIRSDVNLPAEKYL